MRSDRQLNLYITVSHKTVEEMMAQYGFTEDQKVQVAELLAQDSSMWASVLYGIYGADDQIVAVALSQLGNVGGEPYWSWYGFGSRVEWSAIYRREPGLPGWWRLSHPGTFTGLSVP